MHKSVFHLGLTEFGLVLLDTAEHMVLCFECEFNALNFLHKIEKKFTLSYKRIYTTVLLNMMEMEVIDATEHANADKYTA